MQPQQQFIELLNLHQGIVHKVCNLYMDTPADREDLFQEITYQAFKAFKNFKEAAKEMEIEKSKTERFSILNEQILNKFQCFFALPRN